MTVNGLSSFSFYLSFLFLLLSLSFSYSFRYIQNMAARLQLYDARND